MTRGLPAATSTIHSETTFSMKSDSSCEGAQSRAGFEFERRVAEAYRRLGYTVHEQQVVGGLQIDLVLERGIEKIPVEVIQTAGAKQIDRLRRDALRLTTLRSGDVWMGKPVIVIESFESPMTRHWASHQADVEVVRLADIEAQANAAGPTSSREAHIADPEEIEARRLDERRKTRLLLIGQLQAHDRNVEALSASEYEQLCMDVFIFLFDPTLLGFERQAKTTDGGNRYDFICRIAPGRPFWDTLRADFRTRALLFECKNYSQAITADQIYSTERYLFSGALRTVCFLLARKGGDEGCMRAAQGAMRESGKLILVLSNLDLIEMLELSDDHSGPEGVLDERIWRFIISLPR